MNELQTISSQKALGNLAAFGDEQRSTFIKGELLKHSKGKFFRGKDGDEVAPGALMIAAVPWALGGHQKWVDNRPAGQHIGFIATGFTSTRAELGDTDQNLWEIDENGKRRDPWQPAFALYLLNEDGEVLTFVTSSKGGERSIRKLCGDYAEKAIDYPDQVPVVELGVDSYKHSNPTFGRIYFPTFKIVKWVDAADIRAKLNAAGNDEEGEVAEGAENPPPAVVGSASPEKAREAAPETAAESDPNAARERAKRATGKLKESLKRKI